MRHAIRLFIIHDPKLGLALFADIVLGGSGLRQLTDWVPCSARGCPERRTRLMRSDVILPATCLAGGHGRLAEIAEMSLGIQRAPGSHMHPLFLQPLSVFAVTSTCRMYLHVRTEARYKQSEGTCRLRPCVNDICVTTEADRLPLTGAAIEVELVLVVEQGQAGDVERWSGGSGCRRARFSHMQWE